MMKSQKIIKTVEGLADFSINLYTMTLSAKMFITTYELEREYKKGHGYAYKHSHALDKKEETVCFNLRKCSVEEITEYRANGIPSFVLKLGESLFYSEILENTILTGSELLGPHMCSIKLAKSSSICRRLSAISDEKGGCEKVRNKSRYIERYPWITMGYETFNTSCDVFVVAQCSHHESSTSPHKSYSRSEIKKPKLVSA